MLLRSARVSCLLVFGALLNSCSAADITSFQPLVGAEPVAVALQRTFISPEGLPQLDISASSGAVAAVWQVAAGPCDLASATATRSRWIIEIRLHRGGDPLALCVASIVGYRYSTLISGLVPGQYEVRFVDVYAEQTPVEIGRRTIIVAN